MTKTQKKSEIVHIVTGLQDGGAEGVLYRLISSTTEENHTVISLSSAGKYGSKLQALGVPIHTLNFNNKLSIFSGIYKLFSLLNQKNRNSTIIQTWMYHADFLGGLTAWLLGHRNIIWGIRRTVVEHGKKTTWVVARLCALLSGFVPRIIISCSHSGKEHHQNFGYRGTFHVIQNGYSMENLHPSESLKSTTRHALNLDEEHQFIFGCVASWKPVKDHRLLFAGVKHWSTQNPQINFRLLLVGEGCDKGNHALTESIEAYDLQKNVLPLGRQKDICSIMNAIDLHILTSKSEGFPNVIAEAMACGTPCVTTNVGEAAEIVGDTGWIVPPESEPCLAQALHEATNAIMQSSACCENISSRCRARVESEFPLHKMVDAFKKVWRETLASAL